MTRQLVTSDRKYCLEVIELKNQTECDFIILGRELSRIHREGKWRSGWGSYEEYLAEMKMAPSTASKLERIWTMIIEAGKIEPLRLAKAGGWSVVAQVLPQIKKTGEVERYVSMIEMYPTKTDLRRTLEEEASGKDMMRCRHENCYYLRICEDCNLRERVYPDTNGQFLAEVDNSSLHTCLR